MSCCSEGSKGRGLSVENNSLRVEYGSRQTRLSFRLQDSVGRDVSSPRPSDTRPRFKSWDRAA